MVKEFISIREAHLLLACSDGHIRNLVDKARKKKTSHPIPFLDLDGVTVFHRSKLLEWAEQPKQKLRALQSSFSKLGVNLNFHPSERVGDHSLY